MIPFQYELYDKIRTAKDCGALHDKTMVVADEKEISMLKLISLIKKQKFPEAINDNINNTHQVMLSNYGKNIISGDWLHHAGLIQKYLDKLSEPRLQEWFILCANKFCYKNTPENNIETINAFGNLFLDALKPGHESLFDALVLLLIRYIDIRSKKADELDHDAFTIRVYCNKIINILKDEMNQMWNTPGIGRVLEKRFFREPNMAECVVTTYPDSKRIQLSVLSNSYVLNTVKLNNISLYIQHANFIRGINTSLENNMIRTNIILN